MITNKTIIFGLDELDSVVEELYSFMPICGVFTFQGSLGAGKTTLVKAMLARCGVDEVVTSPTFTYVNVYTNRNDDLFYHFDLYRLNNLNEFLSAGFDEFLYLPRSWAFIEWPEVIMSLLNRRVCHISLDYHGDNQRKITYTVIK